MSGTDLFLKNKDYVMSQSQTLVENFEMKHVMEYIHVLMRFDELDLLLMAMYEFL